MIHGDPYVAWSGAEKTSQPTSVVNVKMFDAATFEDPTELTAKALDDGRIRIS